MNIMPFNMLVWRFDDGSTGIDSRVADLLRQWLTWEEIVRLCSSLSKSRVIGFDLYLRSID